MTVILKDTNNGNRKEFETRDQAEEKKNDMVSLGADPRDFEIVENGNDEDDTTDEPETDGGPDQNGETVQAEPVSDDEPLPDRSLSEDPIAWLQTAGGDLTTQVKGTTVITKKGFRVLQHNYDISTTSEVVVGPEDTDHTYCRVKATAQMPDGRSAEAHAGAHVDRGDDSFLLVSLADTRAKSRALSDVTGVGAVAVEEMQGVDTDA